MRDRFSASMITVAIATASASVISAPTIRASAQAPAASGATPAAATLKTPWGDPDLQGIWTDEFDTPLQRPAKYANQEFFTEAQRAELDKERAALIDRDKRGERGTEADETHQMGVIPAARYPDISSAAPTNRHCTGREWSHRQTPASATCQR
jgi:hypothetical protein